jgi:TolB-like protein
MVLLREIKRRKVLHTLSLYVVGCWVVLQVLEVLSGAGLPPTTMRNVLVAMSVGFPFVLVAAWFFDISKEGVTRTLPRRDDEELPSLNVGDHALIVGLLAVLALNAYVLSSPAPGDRGQAPGASGHTLVVLAFSDRDDGDGIGVAFAGELREEFSRVAGVKVLGPETSRAIQNAGDARNEFARDLGVSSILLGDASLENGELELRARVLDVTAGNVVWQSSFAAPVGQGPALQQSIIQAILDAVVPVASADSAILPRVASGECEAVYDLFLRGKQFWFRNDRVRASELMREASRIDPQCGVVWEALSVMAIDWTKEGFAKAGAAARRALEINESLGGAWATLAEIAEEEARWSESERLFLRALYVDPTDAIVNANYAEALLARGRVSDALQYALAGYRYEPAQDRTNFIVSLAARYTGDIELMLKHSQIFAEIRGDPERYGWSNIGGALILQGEYERAAEIFESKTDEYVVDWYPQCVRALADPTLADGLIPRMQETIRQYNSGELRGWHRWYAPALFIECAYWLGEIDLIVDFMANTEKPTEADFFMFFIDDMPALRQTEYFRNLVVESGLLDYWQEWGFSDYCRPEGDSFACD